MNKKTKDTVIYTALVVVVLLIGYYLFLNPMPANESLQSAMSTTNNSSTSVNNSSSSANASTQLQITDEVVGTGATAQNGDTISVLYTGTLDNGTIFDASANHGNQPFSFTLGAGQVIKGWDEGLLGMKVGGKRKLVIPPELAYGSQDVGNGLIPPNSTLTFEVELLQVQAP